jgi:Family of unknown function (DUF5996)
MARPTQERTDLPALPLQEWERTKDTLHLYMQEVGKVQLAARPPRNHWWHVTFGLTARGVSTGPMREGETHFDIEADFIDHRILVRNDRGEVAKIELHDGLAVADFHISLMAALERIGVHPAIKPDPFGVPMKTPFPEDHQHASYQAEYVQRFWRILTWAANVLEEFAGWFCGKQSPVQLFWHSFDLALARYSGRRAPEQHDADPVSREAYSHEVIAFGFWAGNEDIREPAFYSYTAPEPEELVAQPLHPAAAEWSDAGGGHLALLAYDQLRRSDEPRAELIAFLQSAYEAGARTADWPYEELESRWCPAEVSVRS